MLAEACASYPEDIRCGVLATGGPPLDRRGHDGEIDEHSTGMHSAFSKKATRPLIDFPERAPAHHRKRRQPKSATAVAAHGAADRRGFELIGYCNCPEVYVGAASLVELAARA